MEKVLDEIYPQTEPYLSSHRYFPFPQHYIYLQM